MRMPIPLVAAILVLLLAAPALAQDEPATTELEVTGSPLVAGSGGRIEATVALDGPAELRLWVADFDGRLVRELYEGTQAAGAMTRRWGGRDSDGERVADGPYRIVAQTGPHGEPGERAEAWVTVAGSAVYPQRPEWITVVVDPGHGGELSGAVGADGTREADLNLDVGLRLARMLEAAGVGVVITRTTDAFVNTPPEERTGDGVIDADDDLAARPDLANLARADLFLSLHNNTAVNQSVGGPSTFYYDERPFGGRSERLARLVQEEMVEAFAEVGPAGWEPYDHGTLIYPYYVLRGYDPPRLRRPTQMPGVLSEGLFLSNPRELRLLKRRDVRAAMAAAYYDAVARYLAGRSSHVGYALIEAPADQLMAGETATYAVEVRNQGTEPMRGWRLRASAVKAPERYVGRARKGTRVGETRIPNLLPGESAVVEVELTAPAPGRDWTLLFDARDRDAARAANMGSPMLQVPLTTLEPPQLPEPSPTLPAPTPGAGSG